MTERINRRKVLTGAAASLGALPLAGCDLYSQNPTVRKILDGAERLTESAQRLFLSQQSLAPEFTEADISPHFLANGSTGPDDPSYQSMAQSGFADWQLEVGGLVDHPLQLSLRDLRAMPSRDAPLPVPYGAPLRLRLERQLGYKMAKYIMRIEAVESFRQIAGGRGSYWADRGYEWYAG